MTVPKTRIRAAIEAAAREIAALWPYRDLPGNKEEIERLNRLKREMMEVLAR